MAGSNAYRDTQLDGLVHTHSAGWGTGSFYGNWKPEPGRGGQAYVYTPKPVSNKARWNRQLSIEHAKSKNPAARAIGMRRDRQRGYHSCIGGRHWGPRGAAGILPYLVMPDGRVYVAMSLRSPGVQEGNTWSTFGGAIERGETAWQAADRETYEEVDGLFYSEHGDDVVAEVTQECEHGCGWSYTTFIVRCDTFGVDDRERLPRLSTRVSKGAYHAWETSGFAWVPLASVENRRLHSGFARTWGHNRAAIEVAERIAEVRS